MTFSKHGLSLEPKAQLTESELHGKQGLWVLNQDMESWGCGWAVYEKLCEAGRSLCLGQRGCVLNNKFGVELLQTEVNFFILTFLVIWWLKVICYCCYSWLFLLSKWQSIKRYHLKRSLDLGILPLLCLLVKARISQTGLKKIRADVFDFAALWTLSYCIYHMPAKTYILI